MNKCMQKLIYHPMALISLIFTSLLTIISSTTTTVTHHRIPPIKPQDVPPSSDQIHQACKATRNPQLCESSLAHSPNTNPLQIIQSALSISSNNLNTAQSKLQSILNSSPSNPNTHSAAKTCMDYLRTSQYHINSTADVLSRNRIKDCRAWTSAGLTYQYDCLSALSYVNNAKLNDIMSFMDTLISYTSNALSMMMAYDVFGDKTASWGPPKTERDGFWEGGGSGDPGKLLGVPVGLKADVTVCKGGACKYVSVQAAVNAAPDWISGRCFVVVVKAGVYKESVIVGLEKRNVVVLGEGMGKTVISGSLSVGKPGISTYNSATVGVLGDGFMASNLTIENTAGPDANQAVALRIDGDQSVIENCEILGNQDTLYLHSLRHFFKSCHIQGNVDFIFGNSATIFHDCTILIRPRQLTTDKGEKSTITAHGRADPTQTTGFVFINCLVNGTEEYMNLYNKNPNVHINFLGRPWKEFSRTMFISCRLEALITPQGWMPWSGNFALKTLYYGEFNNSGNGSKTSKRVQWSSQIPTEHVDVYSVTNFIQGDQWKLA